MCIVPGPLAEAVASVGEEALVELGLDVGVGVPWAGRGGGAEQACGSLQIALLCRDRR
jgi:hypothetical protein